MPLIEVRDLRKSYGAKSVLRGIDLDVEAGQTLGILGPNGSGKTTAVEIIGGLRARDSGTVVVDGLDPATNPPRLREILGMQLQEARLPKKITTGEALDLYAAFYVGPRSTQEMLERFGLTAQRDTRFENLSGGQQQRLSVALALVGGPRIAILDELTTGLDPHARRDVWNFLHELRSDGLTMLVVTHSMEEAQYLCDRVAIIDDGVISALGSPDELATQAGAALLVRFTPSSDVDLAEIRTLPGIHEAVAQGGQVSATTEEDAVATLLSHLASIGVTPHHLRVQAPSLDDTYLALTREDRDAADVGAAASTSASKENR